MILPLTYYGNPILRQVGRKIETFDASLGQLVQDMLETMHEAGGIGLAAQQIGQALQLAVIDIPQDSNAASRMWQDQRPVDWKTCMPLVLVNPQVRTIKKKSTAEEGCLSFPGINADIVRPARVSCVHQNLDGHWLTFDADGLLGRAVLHEVDHLNGVLFTDHMSPEDKRRLRDQIQAIREEGRNQA